MSTRRNKNVLLVAAFFAVFLASFWVHYFAQTSDFSTHVNKFSVRSKEKLERTSNVSSEDETEVDIILHKFSSFIPSATFTHRDNTTSATNSRVSIKNPREKYCVGETLIIRVETFDYSGNRKLHGGDFLKARIFSPDLEAAATGKVEDFNNGTYGVYFTLLWPGKVRVSVVLHHPSEAVSALWRARNRGYGLVSFVGTFGDGTRKINSSCGFQLDTEKEICEYRKKGDATFFCERPESFHCKSLSVLQSFNRAHSYLSQTERSILTSENVAVEIPKTFESVDVTKCAVDPPKTLQQCKIGMKSPVPSGYCFQNKWRPVFCNIIPQSESHKCLNDKMVYLLGDSTIHQWYCYMVKTIPGLRNFNLHRPGLESMLLAVDLQNKTLLQWKKHKHPFVSTESYSVKDDLYLSDQIDQLAGGPDYAVVLSLGQHFRLFPIKLFIKRVINVRKALERLFLRSPKTKVVVRLENVGERSADPERLSDFHGYIQNMIQTDVFRDLPVAFMDAWDMSIAYNIDDVHPPEHVVGEQVNMFLTYLC